MPRRFRFDRFELDEQAGTLVRCGPPDVAPVHLQPKLFELLVALLERPGVLLGRDVLSRRVWPDVHVTADSLTQAVARLRRALGQPDWLVTVPRRGWRITTAVAVAEADHATASAHTDAPSPPRASPADRAPQEATARPLGRDEVLEAVGAALAGHRWAWIHGPPGVGRSTVLRAGAAELGLPEVELRVTASVARAGAEALGLSLGSVDDRALAAAFGEALSARGEVLVTVDDAHLDEGAADTVARWRRAAPLARFAITSRAPGPGALGPLVAVGPLALADAVALLASRAGVPVDPGDPAIHELVARLDGLPLALVLAAPRLRLLTPRALVARLDQRFEVLRDGVHSLAAALGSAWDALAPDEAAALARLSAVDAPVPLGLAEAVLGHGALDLLQVLVDAGWLAMTARAGEPWMVLPENQRAWVGVAADPSAREQGLARAADWLVREGVTRARSASYHRDEAVSTWLRRHAPALVAAIDAHGAFGRPVEAGLARAAAVAADLAGMPAAVVDKIGAAALANPDLDGVDRARLRVGRGVVAARVSERGCDALRLAADAADATGDPDLRVYAWAALGRVSARYGRVDDGVDGVARALAAAASGADTEHVATAYCARFEVCGRPEGDGSDLDRVTRLDLPADSPSRWLARSHRALLLHEQGRIAPAEAAYRELLAADPTAQSHGNLGNLLAGWGRYAEAEDCYAAAIGHAQRLGQTRVRRLYQCALAQLRIARGEVDAAEAMLAALDAEDDADVASVDVRILGGLAALRDERVALAVHRLTDAVGRAPRDVATRCYAAIARIRAGDRAIAEAWTASLPAPRAHLEALDRELVEAWLAEGDARAERLAALHRAPAPDIAPTALRLVQAHWLLPPT